MSADIDFGDDDNNNITSDWSTHMVRGTWLSKIQSIFHYGLPSPFLECFRKALFPGLHTNCKVIFLRVIAFNNTSEIIIKCIATF